MKSSCKIFLFLSLVTACINAFAQNNDEARLLVKEGVQLTVAGKYTEAIDKYNQALKIGPENIFADFELAYTLFASGKGMRVSLTLKR